MFWVRVKSAWRLCPLYHAFGQSNIQNAVLFGGGTVSYLLRFCPAAAASACARDRVTFFAGVPTMYIGLLNDPGVTTTSCRRRRVASPEERPFPSK